MRINSLDYKRLMVLFGMSIVMCALSIIFHPGRAHAAITFVNDPGGWIPAGQRSVLQNCDGNVPLRSPAFAYWVGPATAPWSDNTNFTVTPGQATVNLRFNWAGVVCSNSSAVYQTSLLVDSTTFFTNNIIGWVSTNGWWGFSGPGNYNTTGTYRYDGRDFTYGPPGGFTVDGTYSFTINAKRINQNVNGTFDCWNSSGSSIPVSGLYDYASCPALPITFDLYIDVNEPIGGVDTGIAGADCNVVQGWSFDADNTSQSLDTSILIDGVTSYLLGPTNLPSPDVNAHFLIAGNHRFAWNWPNIYKNNASHSIVVFATNIGPTGANRIIGSGSVFCPPPPVLSSNFVTTATPSVTLDNDEAPNTITFDGIVKTDTMSVNGIAAHREYFAYRASGGPKLSLNVPPPDFTDQIVIGTTGGTGLTTVTKQVGALGLTAGDTICQSITVNPKSGTVDTGTHNIITNDGISIPSTVCKPISNHPLVTFNGGDVSAGNGYNSGVGCTVNLAANIKAYNQGSPWFSGSGVTLAAFVTGKITGFTTGLNSSNAPINLSFANSSNFLSNNGTNDFGGNFGNPQCITDYYSKALASMSPQTGPVTLGGASVPAQKVVLVNGDLIINQPITLDSTGQTSRAALPYLWVIVSGNIYIQPNVNKVEGIFVAQNGFIDTCANGAASYATANLLYSNCGGGDVNKRLTVNGAFITKKVKLNRVYGRLVDGSGVPAERFNFGPLFYMNSPDFLNTPITNPNAGKFDTHTTLPPVL